MNNKSPNHNQSQPITALSKYLKSFLQYLQVEKGRSALTIRNYRHYLGRFIRYAQEKGVDAPGKITLDLVSDFRLYLSKLTYKGKKLNPLTQNYHLIALRSFLKFMGKKDIETLAPDKIELAKTSQPEVVFLEPEEVEKLLQAPQPITFKGLRDRAILELLFSTGLRVAELQGLDKSQINLTRGEFSVEGKGGKRRVVFLSQSARDWLSQYLARRRDNDEALFVSTNRIKNSKLKIQNGGSKEPNPPIIHSSNHLIIRSRRLSVRQIERIVKKSAVRAGLQKKVTPHVLRHTFATDLLVSGGDIRSVQAMLGHASITTTQIYTHVTDTHLRDVHRAFHGRRMRQSPPEKPPERIANGT